MNMDAEARQEVAEFISWCEQWDPSVQATKLYLEERVNKDAKAGLRRVYAEYRAKTSKYEYQDHLPGLDKPVHNLRDFAKRLLGETAVIPKADDFADRMKLRRSRRSGVCHWDRGACACEGTECPRRAQRRRVVAMDVKMQINGHEVSFGDGELVYGIPPGTVEMK